MTADVLTEVRFWQQVMTDSERTIICEPDLESRIKGWIDARGLGGLITVEASPYCPPGRLIILDPHAIDAALAEARAESLRGKK